MLKLNRDSISFLQTSKGDKVSLKSYTGSKDLKHMFSLHPIRENDVTSIHSEIIQSWRLYYFNMGLGIIMDGLGIYNFNFYKLSGFVLIFLYGGWK